MPRPAYAGCCRKVCRPWRLGLDLATTLAGIDWSALNGYELVVLVQAERRQVAHYEAASYETMTELAHCAPGYAGSPPERHSEIDEFAA